ncbi:hypothetical protein MKW94_028597 [Papaver nudicaule]|uniref:WRKY domain-containing protein n=1 Tax=Papaver nudicaule TaxID=74823 RepID=A0AA41V1S8_PAPNU|nr:hypothetical protein [Papaver nudicaule]
MRSYFTMENYTGISLLDQKPLIVNQLTEAKVLLKQLEYHFDAAATSTTGKLLFPRILSSFESSLSMLKSETGHGESQMNGSMPTAANPNDSPRSICGSPRSNSNLIGENSSKKRKVLPTWTEQARACEHTGLEEPVEDGYSWRKYGQKDIFGAKHPRGYYRCTHKNAQGCQATKQIQRTDKDTSIFRVMYIGRHTCIQAAHLQPGQPRKIPEQRDVKRRKKSSETLINFETDSHIETKDLGTAQAILKSPSFSFSPASIPILCTEEESNSNIFSSLATDNYFVSSPIPSPTTSGSNSLVSPTRVNNLDGGTNFQTSEYDFCEFTSALPSALDSQALYLDWDWDSFDGFCF